MKKLTVLLAAVLLAACGAKTVTGTVDHEFEDKGGNKQVNHVEVTLTDGKIDSVSINETYTTKDGEATTKKDLKEGYNMKKASGIGKEWYEQIEFLEGKLVGTDGKIALGEDGKATDEDIKAGCTIALGEIAAAIEEAIAAAK